MPFVTIWIRVMHHVSLVPGEMRATFDNSNHDCPKHLCKLSISEEEEKEVTFKLASNFRNEISTTYTDDLNDCRTFSIMFDKGIDGHDLTLYNGWNFTSAHIWDSMTPDSFWFADSTNFLADTKTLRIT